MSTIEELRRELEAEWMAQDKILAWPNWLQDQLLKSRQENKAAYSQGYKDALKAVAEKAEREAPALDDGMYGGIATHALQEFAKAMRSLPIPEAK